jgi:hypothetical protein
MVTFNISIFFKLLRIKNKEFDLMFGTTVPPLLSFFGLTVSKLKKIPYCYWVMDLQPELAIQSGLIKERGVLSSILYKMSGFILKKSNLVIVLDRFMEEYVKKIRPGKICISPVWSVAYGKYEGQLINNKFRVDNQMGNKIVVMYSGNHAFIHPLDTLLGAALELKNNDEFLFVFVGDGVRKRDVTEFKEKNKLSNILQIPFQPRENIHNSLAAANLHVVIIGEGQVGFTHPSKIYGALDVGRPIIYIGPSPSHVDDILQNLPGNISINHGQINILVDKLLDFSDKSQEEVGMIGEGNRLFWLEHFNPEISKRNMTDAIEGIC